MLLTTVDNCIKASKIYLNMMVINNLSCSQCVFFFEEVNYTIDALELQVIVKILVVLANKKTCKEFLYRF